MPHQFNRDAFASLRTSANKLIALYGRLVHIEIALKDNFNQPPNGKWRSGHDIPRWLSDLAYLDAGLNALSAQLTNKLSTLICRDKDGSECPVSHYNFPTMRYLLHEQDYAGKSTNDELQDALDCVRDIEAALGKLNIL